MCHLTQIIPLPLGHWYLHISCQQFLLSKSTGESEPTGIESLHGTAWCLRVRITESQSVAITEDSRRETEKDWLKARSQHSLGKVERSETHPQVAMPITVTLAESQTQSLRGALMTLSSSNIPRDEPSQGAIAANISATCEEEQRPDQENFSQTFISQRAYE